MALFNQCFALCRTNSSKTAQKKLVFLLPRIKTHPPKHSNLIHNVVPIPRCMQFLSQQVVQLFTHLNDTSCHRLNVPLPLLKQLGRVQNQRHNTRSMRRWVADLTSLQNRQLALHPVRSLLIRRHDMERSYSLSVQTGILRKALLCLSRQKS